MADNDISALRTLILDLKVEIAGLALAIRTMDKRLIKIEAQIANSSDPTLYANSELDDLLRTRQSRAPRTDSE